MQYIDIKKNEYNNTFYAINQNNDIITSGYLDKNELINDLKMLVSNYKLIYID